MGKQPSLMGSGCFAAPTKEGGEMANEKNLKPVRTKSEARERGKNGGVKSGIARKRKQELRKTIEMIMQLPVDEQTKRILEQLGVDNKDQSVQTAIVVAQAMKAMRGDTKAADYLGKYSSADPRIELERERIAMERERLAAVCGNPDDGAEDAEDVVIYLPENGRNEE